ncbi:hypothetical protein [Bacillus atrophaeus]|uniref:hypothetical protein n=1 Tax=Bacillus atrophaeus TaxID=1452 RepID=UPI002814D9AD|nr:hypothetical protein [Bacillus atrophaeus]
MGQKLFEQIPIFREQMYGLDRKVQNLIGESVLNKIYSSKKTIIYLIDYFIQTQLFSWLSMHLLKH